MSPLDLAAAAEAQQTRLLADACARLDAASSARVEAESKISVAEDAHTKALVASSAKREDDKLADQAGRAGVRLAHAREDHRIAVDAHVQATADVTAAEGRLAASKRVRELAKLLEEHEDPGIDAALQDHGRTIADCVATIRDRLLAVRTILRSDGDRVRRARELGGTDLQMRDGLSSAAGFAAELAARGGASQNGHEPADCRFVFQLPAADTDPDAIVAARSAVAAGTDRIEQGLRFTKAGIAYGGEQLASVAETWSRHKNFGIAREDSAQRHRELGAARDAENARAHNERLRRPKPMQVAGPDDATRARNSAARAAQVQIDAELEARIGPDAMKARHGGRGAIPPNPLFTPPDVDKV